MILVVGSTHGLPTVVKYLYEADTSWFRLLKVYSLALKILKGNRFFMGHVSHSVNKTTKYLPTYINLARVGRPLAQKPYPVDTSILLFSCNHKQNPFPKTSTHPSCRYTPSPSCFALWAPPSWARSPRFPAGRWRAAPLRTSSGAAPPFWGPPTSCCCSRGTGCTRRSRSGTACRERRDRGIRWASRAGTSQNRVCRGRAEGLSRGGAAGTRDFC